MNLLNGSVLMVFILNIIFNENISIRLCCITNIKKK